MAAIIAFSVALLLLVLFLSLKIFEQQRSILRYTTFRTKADQIVLEALNGIQEKSRNLEQQFSVKNIATVFVHHTASFIARSARKVEGYAQDITRKMSRASNGAARTTRSSFLEEVTTHKNGLDTERVRRETSLTEKETQ